MDDEVKLYNLVTSSNDCYATPEPSDISIHMCNIKSVVRAEFYEALRAGQQASLSIELVEMEYNNEGYAEINGKDYKIIRSYNIKEKEITELTLEGIL